MNFIKTNDAPLIGKLRSEFYTQLTAPVDSMWESLYIASSQPYLIEYKNQLLGYCCIDDQQCLTQLFLPAVHQHHMESTVCKLIDSKLISTAMLSSIESVSFNACLAQSTSTIPNTCCFLYANTVSTKAFPQHLTLASKTDVEAIKTFYNERVGFNDNFGYTQNLVNRKELFILKDAELIIATGECRLSDSQLAYADVGVAVHKDHQSKGVGTAILQQLASKAKDANRMPICSTTYANIPAKKAIEKAGFYCANIIFTMHFNNNA
jgi:GNAT superfamily N-acetyltransferase